MRISSISVENSLNSSIITKRKIANTNKSIKDKQTQPSFKSTKGSLIGTALGVAAGLAIMAATGGIGAGLSLGLWGLGAGGYGIAGGVIGNAMTDDDEKTDKKQSE